MTETPRAEFFLLQRAVAGRYSLDRELGRGGMGIVYLARDVALDRLVAIKLLPPELAASRDLRERFLREARTAAQLSHPHIVPIHAVEEHAALVFFVMGYVDGETLGQQVRRVGPLSPSEAMRIMQEVAWALAHAHARGVVHRDVKPDNILLDRDSGRAMVTDFGIARAAESATPAGGVVIGTPQYMSPEQARGETLDGRSDLYSLGTTFFFALTGRLPVAAPSAAALMVHQASGLAAPSVLTARSTVPAVLASAVDRCLAPVPDARFASAAELAETLRAALAARPEVPQAIRRFLADVDATGGEAGTAVTAGVTSLAVFGVVGNDMFGIAGGIFTAIATVMGGLAAVRVARLTGEARLLLRSGYDVAAVRRGAELEERTRGEREEQRPGFTARSAAWLAGGAGISAGAIALANADVPVGMVLVGIAGAIVAPTLAIRRAVRDWLGGRSALRGMLRGRFGRWLFGAAGIGLRDRAAARAIGGEPTVVAIARAADQLFAGLSEEQRRQLGDVPAVIERLEADALALRGAEGDAARERGTTAVAALESLRLDLLRLRAGAAQTGELTRDVQAAERIGEAIDARLAASGDVTPAPNG